TGRAKSRKTRNSRPSCPPGKLRQYRPPCPWHTATRRQRLVVACRCATRRRPFRQALIAQAALARPATNGPNYKAHRILAYGLYSLYKRQILDLACLSCTEQGFLQITDVEHFVFTDAGRRLDLDHIALATAYKRPRHRAGNGNQIGADVGFDVDGGAKHCLAFDVERGRINDLSIRQSAFQFLDAALDKGLTLAGSVVFGVFGKIALGTRLGDGIDDFGTLNSFQTM